MWGVSRLATQFRQLWHIQVMQRHNEAIALDYMIPFGFFDGRRQATHGPDPWREPGERSPDGGAAA